MSTRIGAWAAILSAVVVSSRANEPVDPRLLTVDRIFAGGEFRGHSIDARWLEKGSRYLTLEDSKDPSGGRDIVAHDAATGTTEILVPAGLLVPSGGDAPLEIDDYTFSPDLSQLLIYTNSKRVWRVHSRGDYWVLDRTSRELRKLGGDAPPSSLRHAKFNPQGDKIAFARDHDVWIEDLKNHKVFPLTHATDPHEINGGFDWVYEEEFGLLDGFRFSPDGQSVVFWQLNTEGEPEFPLVNQTDSLYPRIKMIQYPKVGEHNAVCRIGVVPAAGGSPRFLSMGTTRESYIPYVDWKHNCILVQTLNRAQNSDDVLLVNPIMGGVNKLFTERDPAWVDAPDHITWIEGGKAFLWPSDVDGWRRLYKVTTSGRKTPLTPAGVDVIELVHVDEPHGLVYYMASPDNPTQSYLYTVTLDGKTANRVTPSQQPGWHRYQISGNGHYAIHTHSRFDTPPITDLVELPSHKHVRVLADNKKLRKKLAELKPWKTEFFRVKTDEGVELDGWCILPGDLDTQARARYPLLIHVYGEPAAQTVVDRFGGSGYLWHAMLAQQGYVVASIDNRGTPAPRGRAWRKCVYKKIGTIGPADQAAGLGQILKSRPYLDPDRVGVWGWSGGGSSTLHAMFKYPDLYKVGIAIAPVPNQRLYDTIYQERYMGLPETNPEGFTQGSSVNFAKNLQGKLLIIHGTGDDNCHYQGTEQLINELIRYNKPFSMMAYPNRSHGIFEGRNTTLHLRNLMTRYLLDNLPPGLAKAKRAA